MAGQREPGPDPRLLVRPSTEDIPQAGVLLGAALKEGGSLLRETHQYIHYHSKVVKSKECNLVFVYMHIHTHRFIDTICFAFSILFNNAMLFFQVIQPQLHA